MIMSYDSPLRPSPLRVARVVFFTIIRVSLSVVMFHYRIEPIRLWYITLRIDTNTHQIMDTVYVHRPGCPSCPWYIYSFYYIII